MDVPAKPDVTAVAATTQVYLVRHAHAHWQPSEERPLSEEGRAGAAALVERFASTPLDAIYSSPARRAIQTIEPLAAARGLRPRIVPDLRERELIVPPGGSFEAAVAAAWRDPAAAVGGSESNHAGGERGLGVLREAVDEHEGQGVVLSTHGNLMALVLGCLDPSFGYEAWRALAFPDVYRVVFRERSPLLVERVHGR